jgi:cytochrome d ubiquinol oxidase subunit II
VLNTLAVITTVLFRAEVTARYLTEYWPIIFPAGALGAMAYSWGQLRQGKNLWAFFASGAVIALLLLAVAVGIFPNLLISSTDPANNMTIFNAVSQPNTLTVMLIMAAIGMPFVLLYTAGVYYIFRGKVKLTDHSY